MTSLISLLTSAREEDQPRLSVLLCEAVVAVYLSLLIHGLGTHSSNELFRLAAHPLNNRMWAAVFGGGAKVIIKPKRPELPPGKLTIVTGITRHFFLAPIILFICIVFAALLYSPLHPRNLGPQFHQYTFYNIIRLLIFFKRQPCKFKMGSPWMFQCFV